MKVFKTSVLFVALILLVSCTQKQTKGGYTVEWVENFEDSTKLENNWSKIPRGKKDWDSYMSDYDGLFEIKNGLYPYWAWVSGLSQKIVAFKDSARVLATVFTWARYSVSRFFERRPFVRTNSF